MPRHVESFIVGDGAQAALQFGGAAKFVPTSGTHYAYAASTDEGYARLTRTIDLTGGASPHLSFRLGFDTEPDFDHVFVEAHEVGQNDGTTLADLNGHTSTDTDEWCEPDWETLHPFLDHFISAGGCARSGQTGTWNAATGNPGGMQTWDVDLSPWIGKQVELSIAYAQDYGTGGLGVYVDDAGGEDFEHGLGAWSADGFAVRARVVDAPGVTIRLNLTRAARRSLKRSRRLTATLRLWNGGREVAKRTVRLR